MDNSIIILICALCIVPVSLVVMNKPSSSVVYMKENDEEYFICSITGFPGSDIHWFKDNSTPMDFTDDINITDNIFPLFSSLLGVHGWSFMRYTADRIDNGTSIYCTGLDKVNQLLEVAFSKLKPMLIIQVAATHCQMNVDSGQIQWNKTAVGENVSVPCSSYPSDTLVTGLISRECSDNGKWMQPMYNCVQTNLTEIQSVVDNIDGNSSEAIEFVLQTISEVTTHQDAERTLNHKEFNLVYKALEKTVNLENWTVTPNQSENFVKTVSNLLDKRNAILLQSINQQSNGLKDNMGAHHLLDTISAFTTILGKTLDETSIDAEKTIEAENVLLQVKRLNNSVRLTFPDVEKYPHFTQKSSLEIPSNSLNGSTLFYGILYKNLSGLLTAEVAGESLEGGFLNSAVMSARLDNLKQNGDFSVIIKLQHLKKENGTEICGFMTENSTKWMTDGCYVKGSSSTTTICECNHLTNFAILMSPWTSNNVDTETLRVITIAGCSLSSLGLLITMVVHLHLWRYMKSDRVVILMNLCVAMIASYVIFLGGVDRTENKNVCAGMAALLQYIYLVVFFLMLVEGIEISFAVLYVFATKPKIKWMLPAAWVIPAIIVGITLAVTKTKGYGSDQSCWLSIDNGLIWTFEGPALVIILINVVLLGFVIRAVLRVKKMSQLQALTKTIAGIRCLCILLPLLGCTWVIGIFYVNKATSWIQYIFSVCNGCQGVVIFIFHCALNKQITNAYEKKQKRSFDSFKTSSNLPLLTQKTKHSSTSAFYLVNSDTQQNNSSLQDQDFANNDDNVNTIAMKSFGPIKTNDEEEYSRL